MINAANSAFKQWGMSININKTKVLTVGEQQPNNQPSIMLQSQPLEEVKSFPYLGSEIGQSSKVDRECQ